MSDPFLRESSYRVLSDQVGEFVDGRQIDFNRWDRNI